MSLPLDGELWRPQCNWPSHISRVWQATLTELFGDACGPIHQTWKCAGLGGHNASSVSHWIKLKWQIMTVGPTPSSYWLSLCQWGLIEFWEAYLSFASGVLWPKIGKALAVSRSPYLLHTSTWQYSVEIQNFHFLHSNSSNYLPSIWHV